MTIDVANYLTRAAEIIDRHGHCKGSTGDARRGFCALGAMLEVGGSTSLHVVAQMYFMSCVGNVAIADWNDAPERTKDEVTATMRACAAIWRAKQENTDASKAAGSEVRLQDSGAEPEAGIPRGEVRHSLSAETQAAD